MKKLNKCPSCLEEMELVKLDINQSLVGAFLSGGGGGYRMEMIREGKKRATIMTESRNKSAYYCGFCKVIVFKVNPK